MGIASFVFWTASQRPVVLKGVVMALMSHEFQNLNELFIEQLADLYDAEKRLTDALPKMAEAACAPELAQAFRRHQSQTEEHVRRLEGIFQKLGQEPQRETCQGMKGLITEGQKMIKARGDDSSRDAALIAAAQNVEH
jgi:ferritin-like metal-binding protein YciE